MALHSFSPNQKIESAKINENFEGLADGSEIADGAVTADKLGTGADTSSVDTSEATTSSSYTDLATPGPAETVTIGANGLALVVISAYFIQSSTSSAAQMSFALSGANTQAAEDGYSITHRSSNNSLSQGKSGAFLLKGLTPGSTTFTTKYKASGATATFIVRKIAVVPL